MNRLVDGSVYTNELTVGWSSWPRTLCSVGSNQPIAVWDDTCGYWTHIWQWVKMFWSGTTSCAHLVPDLVPDHRSRPPFQTSFQTTVPDHCSRPLFESFMYSIEFVLWLNQSRSSCTTPGPSWYMQVMECVLLKCEVPKLGLRETLRAEILMSDMSGPSSKTQ